jgi:hypothetical protein
VVGLELGFVLILLVSFSLLDTRVGLSCSTCWRGSEKCKDRVFYETMFTVRIMWFIELFLCVPLLQHVWPGRYYSTNHCFTVGTVRHIQTQSGLSISQAGG